MASFFSNVFGQRTSDSEPSASVLAEWNKYSTDAAGKRPLVLPLRQQGRS
jgi:hypothetical protein